ncbi:MAG: response regulator [Magnetococcales bacterium]|nr:response regulator [Magnetococcales bacterium]
MTTNGNRPLRLLILDPSAIALALFARHVERLSDLEIGRRFRTLEEGLKALEEERYDVVCLNPTFPPVEMHAFVRASVQKHATPVLATSPALAENGGGAILHLMEAGVSDLFLQSDSWIDESSGNLGERLSEAVKRLTFLKPLKEIQDSLKSRSDRALLPPPEPQAINLIVIGGDLGSLEPFRTLLAALPETFPIPIIGMIRLNEALRSALPTWIQQHTPLTVRQPENGRVPKAGSLYLPQPGTRINIDPKGQMQVTTTETASDDSPLDATLISVADNLKATGAAIMLSGLESDGLKGALALTRQGGTLWALEPETALAEDLPASCIGLDVAGRTDTATELANALVALTGMDQITEETSVTAAASTDQGDEEGALLMVVEDSPTQAFQMKRTLVNAGFRVVTAKDGQEALETLVDQKPTLVLSDISMPRMNGYELCRAIRRNPSLSDLPVMLVTALSNPAEILEGLDAGADNYLVKPWKEDGLLANVASLLEEAEQPGGVVRDTGMTIRFSGREYHVSTGKRQILELLLSTYQSGVEQGKALLDSQLELQVLNQQLVEQATRLTELNDSLREEIKTRIETQHSLEQTMDELKRANRELSSFAYIVSHDLKAPFRSIGSLTSWLAQDYADHLDKEGRELVTLLANRAERMNGLIESLIQYTNVGRGDDKIEETDLNRILNKVIAALNASEAYDFHIPSPLPRAQVNTTRITQVFHHILHNALRFSDKMDGRVTIRHEETDENHIFYFTDDGPGIEPRHFSKIFQIFQTLQPRDQFETAGVGLALVRKTVERYGGAIEVASEPGHGSTFTVTLPKNPKQHIPKESETTPTLPNTRANILS